MVGHAATGKGPRGTVIQKPIDEGLAEAGLDQKQQAQELISLSIFKANGVCNKTEKVITYRTLEIASFTSI